MKLANTNTCTACMACVDVCHHQAIKVSVDVDGFYQIEHNRGQCVDCGLCSRVCPVINPIVINKEDIIHSNPYAAWCDDSDLRAKSASGGAFAAIAQLFLERNGIVYGAAIDGFTIKHRRVERIEELPFLLGSKYQHSSMEGVYIQVKKDLQAGRIVLFSGLSCQVAGVLSFIDQKYKTNLYTIDTICGGLSTMLPMIRMQELGEFTAIHSFRNKDNGWKSMGYKYSLRMIKEDGGVIDLGMDNLMLLSFRCKETKRVSCLDCRFNGFHRESDITIGDFWGDTRFPEQHHEGLSLLVIHSERIKHYLKVSSLHLESVEWKDVVRSNHNLYWTHYPFLQKSLLRKMVFRKIRVGDEKTAMRLLQHGLLKSMEARFLSFYYERKRDKYLQQVFKDKSE